MADHEAMAPVKVAITRAWKDLAPKLVSFLLGGTAATVIVQLAATYFDLVLDPVVVGAIVVFVGTILGYFTRDTAVIDAGLVRPGEVAVVTAMRAPSAIRD